MKTLQKNLLCGLIMLFSVSTFAQKNQIPVTVNNCHSGYSTTLVLENKFAVEENNSNIVSVAPSFALQIQNRWGGTVSISTLSYSFKISNYSSDQIIDFENFDYLDDAYITDGFSIQSNGNGYDVEVSFNNSSGIYYLIDERATLAVEDVLERISELFRIESFGAIQNNIGYKIEISNVRFTRAGSFSFETCATNYTKTVLLELDGFQKTGTEVNSHLNKLETDNLMFCFPNPAKGQVYLQLAEIENNKSNEDYNILIYNTNGQIMANQKWNPYQAVGLNHLSKGIYSLFILTNYQEIIHTEKLIIE